MVDTQFECTQETSNLVGRNSRSLECRIVKRTALDQEW